MGVGPLEQLTLALVIEGQAESLMGFKVLGDET